MREYRIKELNNKFTIQIKTIRREGWFKQKEVVEWKTTDCQGNSYYTQWDAMLPMSKPYRTLGEAKEQVKLWQEQAKYHYLGGE